MILSAHTSLDLHAALIIPVFNEADSLARVLRSLPPSLFRLVVVADNGSTDGTRELARRGGAMVVIQRQRGYGAACLAAIDALPPEIDTLVFMSADCSQDAADAHRLLLQIAHHKADLALGSRTPRSENGDLQPPPLSRADRLAIAMMERLWGHRFTDVGPFRAIRRDALECLQMCERSLGWTLEMQAKALLRGLRLAEVPVSYCAAAGEKRHAADWGTTIAHCWRVLSVLLRLRLKEGSRPSALA